MKKQLTTKTTLREYKFVCHIKKCGKIMSMYVWSNELDKVHHKCSCGSKITIKNLQVENKVSLHGIRTPTKNR